jgi:hypothetical protein
MEDMEIQNQIDKILSYKTYSDKRKIDSLLEMDATMYCNLGSDSTKTDKLNTKRKSRQIYRAIKTIDLKMGNDFLQHMDQ